MPKQTWYDVPKGTNAAQCKGCKATIYWIETPVGKRMPIDCDVPEGETPDSLSDGLGVSHFTTCPDADRFSRSTRR